MTWAKNCAPWLDGSNAHVVARGELPFVSENPRRSMPNGGFCTSARTFSWDNVPWEEENNELSAAPMTTTKKSTKKDNNPLRFHAHTNTVLSLLLLLFVMMLLLPRGDGQKSKKLICVVVSCPCRGRNGGFHEKRGEVGGWCFGKARKYEREEKK